MHWTSYLAYRRRFPAKARVADDVACIGCGYNLRGLVLSGCCPECQNEIAKSMLVLAQPSIVARDLRMAAKAYLASLAMISGWLLVERFEWMLIVATGIMTIATLWRCIGVIELYARGALVRLPVIGLRLRIFCAIAMLESIAALALLVFTYWMIASGVPAWMNQDLTFVTAVWLIGFFASMGAAGWFGHSLAVMLGQGWMNIEFRLQQSMIAVLIAIAALVTLPLKTSTIVFVILICLFGLALSAASVATYLSLMHLANAAEQTYDMWDEVIEE